MADLYRRAEVALMQSRPQDKCEQTERLRREWESGRLTCDAESPIQAIDDPGRPELPELVDPRQLARRSFASDEGRINLLHAIAHIEFNAINIALDAVYRFRRLPGRFVSDWLKVAAEEARHFRLLEDELKRRGSYYGACQAHRGLWDMVCKTRDDPLHRMALVPRVMEARGLDVTPGMIAKFEQFDDHAAVQILQVIYRDEVGHVAIGDRWFRHFCTQRGVEPESTFRDLVRNYLGDGLRGPFNVEARIEAGFAPRELEALERGL